MNSKDNEIKPAKLSKTAKAALPFFALFGGNGFASSRNPLTLQSSKKVAGKSVVYINDVITPELPTIGAQVAQKTKSPFAAFTNQNVKQTKNADILIKSDAMNFLNKNNLLTANYNFKSTLSGNIAEVNRKSFSHSNWTLNGMDPSTQTGTGYINCTYSFGPSNINYSIFFNIYSANNVNFTLYYKKNGLSLTNFYNSGNVASIKAKHYECDSRVLPVELQKFEVE